MKDWLERYLGFSRKEIQGLTVLIVLGGLLLILPHLYSWLKGPEIDQITKQEEEEIATFLARIKTSNASYTSSSESFSNKKLDNSVKPTIEYSSFNPNALKLKQGLDLGLSERQIQMIHNYVAKGGKFYKKEDFAKIYAISEEDYLRLEPYINIPKVVKVYKKGEERTLNKPNSAFNKSKMTSAPRQENVIIQKHFIELNSTDSIELQLLRGIGPVFASRIIKFRDRLGGFYSPLQLLDVYGMDEERFLAIKDQLSASSELVKKLDINSISYDQLKIHPLLSYKQANAIVQYRTQHGKFRSIQDLSKVAILNEEILLKIAPYLNIPND